MIDYDNASRTYDNSRSASEELVGRLITRAGLTSNSAVLDFGCGTGNYLARIGALVGCRCYGIEPSDGMRTIASQRNPGAVIVAGDHACIPFEGRAFDFVYLTDVIHHVDDIDLMFRNISGCLKESGLVCVATESWEQIDGRWYNRFFPSLSANEKRRYPSVDRIVEAAAGSGLRLEEIEVRPSFQSRRNDEAFIRLLIPA